MGRLEARLGLARKRESWELNAGWLQMACQPLEKLGAGQVFTVNLTGVHVSIAQTPEPRTLDTNEFRLQIEKVYEHNVMK